MSTNPLIYQKPMVEYYNVERIIQTTKEDRGNDCTLHPNEGGRRDRNRHARSLSRRENPASHCIARNIGRNAQREAVQVDERSRSDLLAFHLFYVTSVSTGLPVTVYVYCARHYRAPAA